MSFITAFVAGVTLLMCGQVLGAPLSNPSLDLVQRNVPADDISKYLVQAVWAVPGSSIGDTGCGLYNSNTQDQNNPLREIMADSKIQFIYFSHMSEAYAELCSGDTLLMSETPRDVPQNGIWYNTEFATLTKTTNVGGVVNLVTVFDSLGAGAMRYWKREGSNTERDLGDLGEIFERANGPTTCLTAQQIGDAFGDVNW